jgi:hypothetical protein
MTILLRPRICNLPLLCPSPPRCFSRTRGCLPGSARSVYILKITGGPVPKSSPRLAAESCSAAHFPKIHFFQLSTTPILSQRMSRCFPSALKDRSRKRTANSTAAASAHPISRLSSRHRLPFLGLRPEKTGTAGPGDHLRKRSK